MGDVKWMDFGVESDVGDSEGAAVLIRVFINLLAALRLASCRR